MRLIHFLLGAALASTSVCAAAQLEFHDKPDSQMVATQKLKAAEARRVMNGFARCVARKRKAKAEALLALPYGASEQNEAAVKIVDRTEDCVPQGSIGETELSFQPEPLIGGMAEELALSRLSARGAPNFAALTPELLAQAGLAPRNGAEAFGQCVVLQDMAGTRAFIASKVGTPEETAAAAGLLPRIEQCVTEGQKLALNRPALRILLAVTLHRLLSAPAATSPA